VITVTDAGIPATALAIKYGDDVIADGDTIDVTLGEQVTLGTSITPADATVEDSDFTWTIDPDISHTVSGRDLVFTPTEEGTYDITVEAAVIGGTVHANCTVSVTKPAVTGIEITESKGHPTGSSIAVNSVIRLTASVNPSGADYSASDITWTAVSGNPTLSATSGETIDVTLRYAGTVKVRASIGSHSAEYTVIATSDPEPDPAPSGGGGGGGCNTGPGSGFALLLMSIVTMFFRKKK